MLKFSKKIIFLEQIFYEWKFYKSFETVMNILFFKMESSNLINWLINYSGDVCWSCPSTDCSIPTIVWSNVKLLKGHHSPKEKGLGFRVLKQCCEFKVQNSGSNWGHPHGVFALLCFAMFVHWVIGHQAN
jgi:hypothetical protein